MKKKLSVMTVIILALAICVSAWFYGITIATATTIFPL